VVVACAVPGAPKVRTMEIIDELEGRTRGVYSGSLGYFSVDGSADLNIIIRTAVMTPENVTVGAGGAVVALSDVAAEYDEVILKAEAVTRVFTPSRGPEDASAVGGDEEQQRSSFRYFAVEDRRVKHGCCG
jgi:para-aminobenzoate synthetase